MNKMDRIAVALLVLVLIGWSYFGQPAPPPPVPEEPPVDTLEAETDRDLPEAEAAERPPAVDIPEGEDPTPPEETRILPPEQVVSVRNEKLEAVFTSHGGGIQSVSLFEYAASPDRREVPLVLDFGQIPALGYAGMAGVSADYAFDLQVLPDRTGVRLTAASDAVQLERIVTLRDGYQLEVEDRFINRSDADLALENVRIQTGEMLLQESGPGMRGMAYLGVDYLQAAEEKVQHTGKKLRGYFGVGGGCSTPDLRHVPLATTEQITGPMRWVAVKNKFFVQILEPADGVSSTDIQVRREDGDDFRLASVRAELSLAPVVVAPGDSYVRTYQYYAGPKKYTLLRRAGDKRGDIMEFGRFFKWVCQVLLPLLNAIEWAIPGGYGVAVILLTIIVKLVFWPVTHKGTESMKRMQRLQPEIKKLREKYKNEPKKLQQKQMLLYREHKVNPLAGCLPMVIQIPVFIGLFTVLRSAVELRYARFLWISDLSEPEGLLAGVLPFPATGLNILPLLMTATMVLQQRMMPSGGDPQQQKMMAFMPVMMLFIFYNMPSALVLYWTVSQLLSILQLYIQKRRDHLALVAA